MNCTSIKYDNESSRVISLQQKCILCFRRIVQMFIPFFLYVIIIYNVVNVSNELQQSAVIRLY